MSKTIRKNKNYPKNSEIRKKQFNQRRKDRIWIHVHGLDIPKGSCL